jgi:hypothetical protein
LHAPALHFLADRTGRYPWRGQLASRSQLTLRGPAHSRHVRGQPAPGGTGTSPGQLRRGHAEHPSPHRIGQPGMAAAVPAGCPMQHNLRQPNLTRAGRRRHELAGPDGPTSAASVIRLPVTALRVTTSGT